VGANGLLLVDKGEAFLFDSPWNDAQTEKLLAYIYDSLKTVVSTFIPGHWHGDCVGGIECLHSKGVKSYANQMTVDILKEKGLPVPQQGFKDSLSLKLNDIEVYCYYLGAGHSTDNIVAWIPSEQILFGGCMVKDLNSKELGNLSDAKTEEWPETIQKVIAKFPDVKTVIPGHGRIGGIELLKHTKELLQQYATIKFNHKTGKYLEVDGANIYYEEIENTGKPTLLLLHSGFGNIEDFNSILPVFINDYHIIGIDSRGHGKSTLGTNKLTYKRLQLDVETIINHLQLENIDIIGYSDGGIIAYRLAVANKISIRKIVTIGGTWSLSDAELMEKLMAGSTPEDNRNYFKQSFDFHQEHNPLPDFDKFAKCVTEMWTDKTEDGYPHTSVENIIVPMLIIRGNDDYMFSLESAVELTTKVKNSLLLNIPFAPHRAFRKYPQIFEIVTKEFLNKHEK
jgi:metallo-beta-lactamase class B